MTTIKVSGSVQVAPTAPALTLSAAIEVEAYTQLEFVLTEKAPTKTLDLGKLGDTTVFVLIKADLTDSDAAVKSKLAYKAGSKDFTLDAPHLYLGKGFVQSLDAAGIDFSKVVFTFTPLTDAQIKAAQDNKQTIANAKSVTVEILVGGPAKSA